MKKTLILATYFVAAAGAAGAGAIHFATSPYAGSDTEFLLQNQAIENSGLGNTGWTPTSSAQDYAGGGSGGAENAMTGTATQQTGPMSRMLKGGAGSNACAAPYNTAGSLAAASGFVIGIDAARVFASSAIANNATCNGTVGGGTDCNKVVGGLAYDSSNASWVPAGQNPPQNWRDVLALIYGGLDKDDGYCSTTGAACNPYTSPTTCTGTGAVCNPVTDCTSTRRQALIAKWGNLFENGCAGSTLALCGDGVTTCGPNGSKNGTTVVPVGSDCADGSTCTAYTGLRHAFRRDDNSGTSDVFSSLLGMQAASVDQYNNPIAGYSVSSEAANSFGTSPYCNALNWDTAEVSAKKCFKGICSGNQTSCTNPGGACASPGTGTCVAATDRHYDGPGGIALPHAQDVNCGNAVAAKTSVVCHHVPVFTCGVQGYDTGTGAACSPLGGTCVAGTDNRCPAGQTVVSAVLGSMDYGTQPAVLPTSYQDNDPIRVNCLETGSKNHPGEDVCNTDGKLGLVLPIPPVDFIPDQNPGVTSYTAAPTTAASTCQNGVTAGQHNVECKAGAIAGDAPTVFTCAPSNITNTVVCPNNDPPLAIGCLIPIGLPTGGTATSQCQSFNTTATGCFTGQSATGGTPCGIDGRVYNEQVYDGTGDDSVHNAHYVNFTVGGVALNDTGAYARIHQRETALIGANESVCQIGDATQNLGCLVQADPNSISYGGNTGDAWDSSDPLKNGTCSGQTTGLRVHEIGSGIACVPSISGPTVSYPLWRKLYMNSEKGFASVTALNEQELAAWEGDSAHIDPIMTQYNEFALPFSPNNVCSGTQTPCTTSATCTSPATCVPNPNNASAPLAGNTSPSPAVFCEDFNEYAAGCSAVAASAGPGNANGCATNVVGATVGGAPMTFAGFGTFPYDPSDNAGSSSTASPNGDARGTATMSTVCGNGIVEEYEDCDPGTTTAQGEVTTIPANYGAAGQAACGTCSSTCRCSLL